MLHFGMTPEGNRGHLSLNRRGFLAGASAVAVGGVVGVVDVEAAIAGGVVPLVPLGTQPAGLPARQHAWGATLKLDSKGDPISPRFDRLLFFNVNGHPTPAYARMLEAALRTLERRYHWGPGGLLFTAGWGSAYFEHVLGVRSPIPRATRLSTFERPAIDDYHLCLHLACDNQERLAAIEAAIVRGAPLSGAHGTLAVSQILSWRETRTGFVGTGLPAAHQHVRGIPRRGPVPRDSPLFMGFKSGLVKNQATEDSVTIPGGPFGHGTTMQVSYMRLQLDGWYNDLSQRERVARMYAPQVTPEQVKHFTTDAESDPNLLPQAISRYGVIGHAQTSARARRNGRPRIIRRDFNTTDGGRAGLHFVSVQRTIDDFIITRNAMNASDAHLHNRKITDTANNGINAFMSVLRRANYVLPSRQDRSFPLLPGRGTVL
jgi:hypothetical protein